MIGAALIEGVSSILRKYIDNKTRRERLAGELVGLIQKSDEFQAKINIEEAKHKSIFVAGWRPALGWLCVISLAYTWILRDLLVVLFAWLEPNLETTLPRLDSSEMMTLVVGMLGMGALRTAEKIKHVSK